MDELKPCPFCGEIPSYVTKEGFLPIYPANKTAWCSCKFNGCPNAERTYSVIEWEERPGEAAAEQRGYGKGEEHGYACGWKQAMVAVENNGCSKLGMITIPISLLRLLSDKYLKEEGNPNGN